MINKINSWQDLIARAKRLSEVKEVIVEFANSYDEPQAKFSRELKKPGVREFSLNGCRVAATPEEFRKLERGFKLGNMSVEDVNEFSERVIAGINKMFDYNYEAPLTLEEEKSVREVILKYFDMKRD